VAQSYLLIVSRDPFEFLDVQHTYQLAAQLKAEQHEVTVFLVQNGVLAARAGSATQLAELGKAGVKIWADDFSLKERGIGGDRLVAGVVAAPIGRVVEQLGSGTKTLWS
jgi:predicted peroxiredoxin